MTFRGVGGLISLPEFVVRDGADRVIMGSVAHLDIEGIGTDSSAERVLGTLPCPVLPVTPAGFVRSVPPDAVGHRNIESHTHTPRETAA